MDCLTDSKKEFPPNDLVPRVVFTIGSIGVAAALVLAASESAEEPTPIIIQRVPICNGDILHSTKNSIADEKGIVVSLTAQNKSCIQIRVPLATSIEDITVVNNKNIQVQSIFPEYLLESGYLSQDTLGQIDLLHPSDKPIWIHHPVDATDSE